MNPEDVASPQERKEPAENREAAEDFASPEAAERLTAEAASEVADLEAGGLPAAEKLAAKLDTPIDAETKGGLETVASEAEQAKEDLGRDLGGEAKREGEPVMREFEYRDSEGKLICKAVMELGAETTEGLTKEGRLLKSLKLLGEKDGKPTEVDVMKLANAHGVEIFIAEGLVTSKYSFEEKKVEADAPEYPHNLAVLLHELGHADQASEPEFGELVTSYRWDPDPATRLTEWVENDIKGLAETMPDLAEHLPGKEFLQEHGRLTEEKAALGRQKEPLIAEAEAVRSKLNYGPGMKRKALETHLSPSELEARRAEYEGYKSEATKLEGEIARIQSSIAEVDARMSDVSSRLRALVDKTALKELLAAPTKILERDATSRALKWMRKIREEAGIDLFRPSKVPDDKVGLSSLKEKPEGSCERATADGLDAPDAATVEFTAREYLMEALDTYEARSGFRVKPQGDADIGFMPGVRSGKKPRTTDNGPLPEA